METMTDYLMVSMMDEMTALMTVLTMALQKVSLMDAMTELKKV